MSTTQPIKPQVMVVDDDLSMCNFLRSFLAERGYAAVTLGSPDETDLEVPLANALKQRQLSREVASLREELQSKAKHSMLFGHSERMAEVHDLIDRVADTDVTVLIRGESGTGKELVARALYASSL